MRAQRPVQTVNTVVAGVDIEWRTDCAAEAAELRRALRHHLRSPGEPSRGERHSVTFRQVSAPVSVPAESPVIWEGPFMGLVNGGCAVKWLRAGDGRDYLILTDEITIIHDRAASSTECLLLSHEENGKWVRPRVWDAIVLMLHTILSMYGRYSLHSAAVGIDGKAYLFTGESGHGKSTLSTDLVGLGAAFMGDDLTFIYLKEGVPVIGSLLLDAKLFPSRFAREKKWVDIVELTGCEAPLELPLAGVFYLERGRGQCRCVPAEPIDGMVRLIAASNNPAMQWDARMWQDTLEAALTCTRYCHFSFGKRNTLTKEIITG